MCDKVVCVLLLLYLKCVVELYLWFDLVEVECLIYVNVIDCM